MAGHREPAPPSKFSNEGGFRKSVFKGIVEFFNSTILAYLYPFGGVCLRVRAITSIAVALIAIWPW